MNENKYNPNSLLNRLKFLGAMAIIFAGALLVILALFSYFNTKEAQNKLDDQSGKITEIVQQNKDLAEQNKELSKQAAAYAYCNILLLSKYSQDLQPFTVEDANTCVTKSFSAKTSPLTLDNSTSYTPQTYNPTPVTETSPTPTPSVTPTPSPASTSTPQKSPLLGIDNTPITPGVHLTLPCISLVFGLINAC